MLSTIACPVPARLSLLAATLLLATACSHGDQTQSSAAGSNAPAAAADAASAAPEGGATSTLHFVLTGGKDAGSYDAKSKDGGCSYGYAERDAWGEQYSDADVTNGMSSVQMVVPGGKAATAGTKAFKVTVTIGGMLNGGRSYDIDTQPDHNTGSGTVTVTDHGSTATYTVDGTTADGVQIRGTVTCNQVTRAG